MTEENTVNINPLAHPRAGGRSVCACAYNLRIIFYWIKALQAHDDLIVNTIERVCVGTVCIRWKALASSLTITEKVRDLALIPVDDDK